MSERSMQGSELAETAEKDDLGRVRAALYIAHRPHSAVPIAFEVLKIDGVDLLPGQPTPLPASQGWEIGLGTYASGRTVALEWKFVTKILADQVQAKVGVYFGSLHNRKELKEVVLDTHQSYGGSASLEIR